MSQPHWACPHSRCVCPPCPHSSGSRLLHREPSEAGPGLHAPPRSKPLRFRYSGAEELKSSEAQTWLGLRFVPFPGLSSSGDQVFGERSCCDLSPPPSLSLGFLGVQPVHLLWWMLTVQNPKKSWLAMKPACSLVDDASLGLQLPPSGSGCPRLPVSVGDGPVRSWLALVSPLFCERAWWCLRLGLFAW